MLVDYNPAINLLDYDGFVFYVHRASDTGCSAGLSNTYGIEPRPTYIDSYGIIDTRILYIAIEFYLPYQAYSGISDSTVAHELIHSLGACRT